MQGWRPDRVRLDSSEDAYNDFVPGRIKPNQSIDDGWVTFDLSQRLCAPLIVETDTHQFRDIQPPSYREAGRGAPRAGAAPFCSIAYRPQSQPVAPMKSALMSLSPNAGPAWHR